MPPLSGSADRIDQAQDGHHTGAFLYGSLFYYPMYHPAAALHQPSLRRTVEEDVLKIPELLAQMDEMAESKRPEQAEQLSLF